MKPKAFWADVDEKVECLHRRKKQEKRGSATALVCRDCGKFIKWKK